MPEEDFLVVDILLGELAHSLPRVLSIQQLPIGGGPAGGGGGELLFLQCRRAQHLRGKRKEDVVITTPYSTLLLTYLTVKTGSISTGI